jgi:signal transduction histidine kinase
MRTPLTAILGYAEYMQKTMFDEEQTIRLTGRIAERAKYMNDIAELLMQLANLREYTPKKTEINVQRLFEDVTQTLQDTEKGVSFICKSDNVVLCGHEGLLKSLLLNLCINSAKACSHGNNENGEICLTAQASADCVTISVSDNGCGIPAESLDKVTEAFYRVDKARSAKDGGAGLGLALCKQIADIHNAEIRIESAITKGTTVFVIFTTP